MTLSPCPFCGSDAEIRNNPSSTGRYYWVECGLCGGKTKALFLSEALTTRGNAVQFVLNQIRALWNTRTPIDE